MGMRRMNAGGKKSDQRERLGFGHRLRRPQSEALAEIRQNGGVLGEGVAIVETQRRHPSLRIDLEVGLRALLAAGQIDLLRLVFLAALFQDNVRSHRARSWSVIERQHAKPSLTRFPLRVAANSGPPRNPY